MLPRDRVLLVHLVLQVLLPLRQHLQRAAQAQDGILRAVLFLRRITAPKAAETPARHLKRLLLVVGGEDSHSMCFGGLWKTVWSCLRVVCCFVSLGWWFSPRCWSATGLSLIDWGGCLLRANWWFERVIYADRMGKWLPMVFRKFLVQLSLPRR
jgi:hypothetical protein